MIWTYYFALFFEWGTFKFDNREGTDNKVSRLRNPSEISVVWFTWVVGIDMNH